MAHILESSLVLGLALGSSPFLFKLLTHFLERYGVIISPLYKLFDNKKTNIVSIFEMVDKGNDATLLV
jgi:hypothetical protein